jgi:hypothetical protein
MSISSKLGEKGGVRKISWGQANGPRNSFSLQWHPIWVVVDTGPPSCDIVAAASADGWSMAVDLNQSIEQLMESLLRCAGDRI